MMAELAAQGERQRKLVARARLENKLSHLDASDRAVIPRILENAFGYIKARSAGEPVTVEDCATLAMLAMLLRDQIYSILAGPLMNEPLLKIGHRIPLFRESYLKTFSDLTEGAV